MRRRLMLTMAMLLTVGVGGAQGGNFTSPTRLVSDMPLADFREKRQHNRQVTNRVRERKCRYMASHFETRARDILPWRRRENLDYWRRLKERAWARDSRCDQPRHVIRYVFPAATEDAATSVASCETVRFTDFLNESSGAAGLFQLMPLHWAGKFDPFNMLANARFSHRLSNGGRSWAHWECKP